MRRLSRWAAVSGLGVALVWGASTGYGQPPIPGPPPVPADLNAIAGRMAEQVQMLGEDIATDLGNTPRSRHLQDDTRELAQAVNEFRASLAGRADQFQARQAYSGIDASWHHLASQFSQQGSSSPAIDRDAQRVAQTDAQIHTALAMNAAPAGYYAGAEAPTGAPDLQRLSHALVDRAEALAGVVRADMVGPGGGRAVQDAVNLAQVSDTFHDGLRAEGQIDATVQNGFSGVAALSDRLEADFAQAPPTPRVQAAWQAYRATEVLVRQSLGLANDPADLTGTVLAPPPQQGPPPVNALADQLVQQITAFVQVFSQTAGAVPEGGLFLGDAQALQAASVNFQQDVNRNLTPAQLAFEFRDVDAVWQRLARRTNRIARGRTGPNIQQVAKMGQTVSEIHRLLGIPGYAPTFAMP